jgi:hypothetical protein
VGAHDPPPTTGLGGDRPDTAGLSRGDRAG